MSMSHHIAQLCEIFCASSSDAETLREIKHLASNPYRWNEAHELFTRIRQKNLAVSNPLLQAQYRFEEVCAKSLYNVGKYPAPFDPDSQYWVIPRAIQLAHTLKIDVNRIITIVMS